MKVRVLAFLASAALVAGPASAQSAPTNGSDRLRQILGTIFGQGTTANTSLEGQWQLGRTPLANQRAQFDARVDSDVQSGALTSATGARLKSDYAAVVQLEARYAADGIITSAERADLVDRYGTLTQVLADRGYTDNATAVRAEVAEGQATFNARVDGALAARNLTRVNATRLKNDYAGLVQLEASYLRDGVLSTAEREDLDARLDNLDARLDARAVVATPRSRLDAIARALPTSRLTAVQQAQLRVEHGDLTRLAAAYERVAATAEERAYLEARLTNLETRARVMR